MKEISIVNTQGVVEISAAIEKLNDKYLDILEQEGLPTEKIVTNLDDRKVVISNLSNILNQLESEQLCDSIYLSKFFIAVATGLFDAALNYLWNETIRQLRIRVVNGELDYFFDVVINDDSRRNKFNTREDLEKLPDNDLITGAAKLGLITPIGFKQLDLIRYMRNSASAAHPNHEGVNGYNLLSWLNTCIQEVISTPIRQTQINTVTLLTNLKNGIIDDEDIEIIKNFFKELNDTNADSLILGFFGLYTNKNTSTDTRQNINKLAPALWELVSEEVRAQIATKYAMMLANGDSQKKQFAKNFLQIVKGFSYVSDPVKIPMIQNILKSLEEAHYNTNNFYNEPEFAEALRRLVDELGGVPRTVNYSYVYTLITVFLTNGVGESFDADPIYVDLIRRFENEQILIALTSFTDDAIRSKLQFERCKNKYLEMIDYLQPNILSEVELDFSNEIKNKIQDLFMLERKDDLIIKANYLKKKAGVMNTN